MPEDSFLQASLPLFESGEVDALEWSFDTAWFGFSEPDWMPSIINEYSSAGRLYGHGVNFSLLDGKWKASHTEWMERLSKEVEDRQYRHITEHFGYMNASEYGAGSPLPPPLNDEVFEIACERFQLLKETAGCPVGLENLAFDFSRQGALDQYSFLNRLLKGRGFLLLDVHNLYCQIHNFSISLEDVACRISPHLVKEIHVSGGSWSFVKDQKIRRDTHDDSVPDEVFKLLEEALDIFTDVEIVVFERLGNTLHPEVNEDFVSDFRRIKAIAAGLNR